MTEIRKLLHRCASRLRQNYFVQAVSFCGTRLRIVSIPGARLALRRTCRGRMAATLHAAAESTSGPLPLRSICLDPCVEDHSKSTSAPAMNSEQILWLSISRSNSNKVALTDSLLAPISTGWIQVRGDHRHRQDPYVRHSAYGAHQMSRTFGCGCACRHGFRSRHGVSVR